jgi:tetratricopeptide (TPR) repeat protein
LEIFLRNEILFRIPANHEQKGYDRSMEATRWWHIYGVFDEGEDDLPHMGQVLSHYMKLNGLKANALKDALHALGWDIGVRRVEQMLSDKNKDEPQSISRRRLLSKLLCIPPALIGLSIIGDKVIEVPLLMNHADRELIAQTELALASFWENFYSSSVHTFDEGIVRWQTALAEHTHAGPDIQTLLCKFDQLVAVSARDRGDYPTALYFHDEAASLAREINNPELIASSLFRRAKTHVKLQRYQQASDDMREAIPAAHRSRANLRGYIYQFAGQLVTLGPSSRETIDRFQRFMGEAGKVLTREKIEDDGSFVRFTMSGYQQDAARGYLRLGKAGEAIEAIEAAERQQQPHMTRWQAETFLLKSEAYLQINEVEWASHCLQEGIKLIQTVTHSSSQKNKVEQLRTQFRQRYPRHPETLHLQAMAIG